MIYRERLICLAALALIVASLNITVSFAQQLGQMKVERAMDGQTDTYIVRNPDVSVLVVHSEIDGLNFTNPRILEKSDPAIGVYHLKVEPGVNYFTFSATGFQSVTRYRLNMPEQAAITVNVTVLKEAPSPRGTLQIMTSPPGATISLDAISIADKSPVTLTNQATGLHSIRIEMDGGYIPIDTTINIDSERISELFLELEKYQPILTITSNPSNARVLLDDIVIGRTPLRNFTVDSGNKELLLVKDGYEIHSERISLKDGDIITKHINLNKFNVSYTDNRNTNKSSLGDIIREEIPMISYISHIGTSTYALPYNYNNKIGFNVWLSSGYFKFALGQTSLEIPEVYLTDELGSMYWDAIFGNISAYVDKSMYGWYGSFMVSNVNGRITSPSGSDSIDYKLIYGGLYGGYTMKLFWITYIDMYGGFIFPMIGETEYRLGNKWVKLSDGDPFLSIELGIRL